MYICVCNAIKVAELRVAAGQISGDAEAIYTALGRPPQCRQCLEEAEDIIADQRSAHVEPLELHH